MRTITFMALLAYALLFQACTPSLVEKGKTDFKIVLSDSPQPVEQTAANELKACLDKITGINWIITSSVPSFSR